MLLELNMFSSLLIHTHKLNVGFQSLFQLFRITIWWNDINKPLFHSIHLIILHRPDKRPYPKRNRSCKLFSQALTHLKHTSIFRNYRMILLHRMQPLQREASFVNSLNQVKQKPLLSLANKIFKPGPYFLRDTAQAASREWISPDWTKPTTIVRLICCQINTSQKPRFK